MLYQQVYNLRLYQSLPVGWFYMHNNSYDIVLRTDCYYQYFSYVKQCICITVDSDHLGGCYTPPPQ